MQRLRGSAAPTRIIRSTYARRDASACIMFAKTVWSTVSTENVDRHAPARLLHAPADALPAVSSAGAAPCAGRSLFSEVAPAGTSS